MTDGMMSKAATMEIPINSNGDTGTLTEDDGLEQVSQVRSGVQSIVERCSSSYSLVLHIQVVFRGSSDVVISSCGLLGFQHQIVLGTSTPTSDPSILTASSKNVLEVEF